MYKLKYLILITLLCFMSGLAKAQKTTVLTGKVYEIVDGEKQPVPGANVVVVNSQKRFLTGVPTGPNGEYNIRIPVTNEKLKILVSFIGLKSKAVDFKNQATLDFTLEADTKQVDEVVVEARHVDRVTGITAKQQTSATQRVSMDEIMANSPATSVEDALQGQLGGVDIISGGDPGARSSIRIRGTSTLNGNAEPLIVIDGIPYPTDIDDDFNFSTANEEDYGQLLNIAPSDIESIEVLKDAAATAIWGTQGGNGVLMITTKKGSKGKTRFSFTTKASTKIEPDPIPMLNGDQYVALMQEAIWNTANAKGLQNSYDLLELLYDTPEINYSPSWRYFDEYNVNTNWLDEVRRTAFTTDNNFSMQGGGDKATYRFSLGYLNEQGTTIGTNFDRITSKLNIYYNFSTKLRVSADFAYTQAKRKANYKSGKSSWRNVRSEAMAKMPNKSPFWIDNDTKERTNEYFSRQNDDEFQGAFTGQKNYNPVAMAKEGYCNTWDREAKITFRLDYHFNESLTYSGWASMLMNSTKNKKFLPQVATGVTGLSSYANQSTDALSDNFTLQTENKLVFRKNWDNLHNVIANAIFRSYQVQKSSYTSAISGTASAGSSDPITGGDVADAGSGNSEKRSVSAIFNAHYTYKDRYMLSGTVNMEGNSNLGESERWGLFPSVGFAWHMQEEEFMSDIDWVSMAKFRISYGESGSAPGGNSPYVGTFKSIGENYMDMAAIAPVSIQLNNLKWESSKEYNAGIDLELLDARLKFTFDWYNKTTDDLIQKNYSIPASTGYTTIAYYNSGKMRNKGLEFRVDYDLLRTKDWRVSVNANISRNVNEILELPAQYNEESYTFDNGEYAQRLESGVPVGSFYGYKYLGVYQNLEDTYALDSDGNIMNDIEGDAMVMRNGSVKVAPGDAKYKDMNNDGVINKYDITYIGNGMPVMTGGGGFQVSYKGLKLTTFFHGRFGQKVINTARMNSESMYNTDNQSTATLKRWRNEGDDTDIPRALYDYGYNYLGSDRFVENASYIRLKTLSLSYNIPRKVCQRWGFNNLNVFLTGYNLFTWTKYTGQDPEVSLPSDPTDLVKDKSDTPVAKRFACGITLNF